MNELTVMISSLGFPIVAAVGLSFYVVRKEKSTQQHESEIIKTLTDAHKEESAKLADVIEKNTAAIEKLSRRIDKIV